MAAYGRNSGRRKSHRQAATVSVAKKCVRYTTQLT